MTTMSFKLFLLIGCFSTLALAQEGKPTSTSEAKQTAPLAASELYAFRQKGVRAMADGIYAASARFFLDYRKAVGAREPDLTDATILLVKVFLLQEKVPDANAALDYQAKHSAGVTDAYYRDALIYWRGAVQLAAGSLERSTKTVAPLLEEGRTQEFRRQALELQADAYAKLGRWQQAQVILKQLLAEFPKSTNVVRANLALVKAYLAAGQMDLADDALALLAQDNQMGTREVLELFKVVIHLKRDELDKALGLYRKIQSLRPLKGNEDWWLATSLLANQLIKTERYKDALTVLPQVAQLAIRDKDVIQAKLQQAECQMALGNTRGAIEVLERFRTEHADALEIVPVLVRLAELLRQEKQLELAVTYLSDVAENPAVSQELRYRAAFIRGWCYTEASLHNSALTAFMAASNLGQTASQKAEALLLTADAAFRLQDYAGAATYYQSVADTYATTAFAEKGRFRQGQSLVRAKEFDLAAKVFQSFSEDFPESERLTEAKLERGIALRLEGNVELAMKELADLATTDPESVHAPHALMEAYQAAIASTKPDTGIQFLSTILKMYPHSDLFAQALYERAKAFFAAGRNDEAVKDAISLVDAFPLLPQSADALIWLGDHYGNEGDALTSERFYLRLVTSQPASSLAPVALYEAALSSFRRGDLDKVLPLLKQFMIDYKTAEPTIQANIQLLYGDLMAEKGRYAEALPYFVQARDLSGKTVLGLSALGRQGDMHYSLGSGEGGDASYKHALEIFDKLLASDGLSEELQEKTLYRRAKVLEKLERIESAIKDYMDIVYSYDLSLEQGKVRDWYYFARAGYDAARLFLQNKQERLAARTYERLAATAIPTATDASKRAAEIRQTFQLND